jgi:ubiquinone/menaquinone biosynthesis C-methylase UbiE
MNPSPPGPPPSLLHRFLRFVFQRFYHGFAWTYDFVAAAVSLGQWKAWVACALPYIEGRRVLEIGHGPGHLQLLLRREIGSAIIGLDESVQMGRLARRALARGGYAEPNLSRGLAQALPFESGCFDTVVSTFPAEYIFEPQTLQEVKRVLSVNGHFILVPAAWIVGGKALERAAAWLFRATDQSPHLPVARFASELRERLEATGFSSAFETVQVKSSEVLVVIASV